MPKRKSTFQDRQELQDDSIVVVEKGPPPDDELTADDFVSAAAYEKYLRNKSK